MESISIRLLALFRNPETTLEYAEGKTLNEGMIIDGMKNDIHASQKRIENAARLNREDRHSYTWLGPWKWMQYGTLAGHYTPISMKE